MKTFNTTSTNTLTARLNNSAMDFIGSIDPKNITSTAPFEMAALDTRVLEQLELELTQSFKLFKNKVKRFVSNSINISNIEGIFEEYINALEELESKHSKFHIGLMRSNKNTKAKWLNVAMTELISQELNSSRYLELNHIAYLIGKTLVNKEHNGDVTIAVSLGANILEFLRSINLASKSYVSSQENHRIATVRVNQEVIQIPSDLVQAAKDLRASSPMLVKPLAHSGLQEGGHLLSRGVMLNSSKLTHGQEFYKAVNYINNCPLNIRTTNEIVGEWFTKDRFYSNNLTELKGEKAKVIADLERFSQGRFYISHKADSRGRLYSTSNYINPQGDSYQKSMLIGEKEVLTEQGLDALRIAIVNEVYSDKITREDALVWFNENQDNLQLNTPISKVLYMDYLDALAGKAVGSILHQDMTNSGLAIYSLLGRDEKGAALTNLLNIGELADAYGSLAQALNGKLGISNLTRDTVKKAFMVFLYGSGKNLLVSNDLDDARYTSLLHAVSVGLNQEIDIDEIWVKFQEAMEEIAPAAIKLMDLIYKFKREDSHYRWVMPDGFVADIQVMNKESIEHRGFSISIDGKTHQHSINTIEVLKDNRFDKSLAPHVIHSIDAYLLRVIVRKCEEAGIPIYVIHDSFGTTPNYYHELNQIAREVFSEAINSNLLEDILTQLDSNKLELAKSRGMLPKGKLTSEDILNAVNAIR